MALRCESIVGSNCGRALCEVHRQTKELAITTSIFNGYINIIIYKCTVDD